MSEAIDDREPRLPRWAQTELHRLRHALERAETYLEEARAEHEPKDCDTILEPYGEVPKGLGNGPRVRFVLPGGPSWRNYVDVRVTHNGELEAMAGYALAVLPTASNVVRFMMADDIERSRKP